METQARPLVARVPTCKLSPELKPIVDEAAKDFEIIVTNPGEINKQLAQRVEGLVKYSPEHLRIDANVMELFPNLKVISNYGVGEPYRYSCCHRAWNCRGEYTVCTH